jgi:hypothetical protein
MGQYVINDDGAMEWEADRPPRNVEVEHTVGETPPGHEHESVEPKKAATKKAASKDG